MRISSLLVTGISALLFSTVALADIVNGTHSTIQINFNSGFDDATVVSAVGGNTGTTVGQQRKNAYLAAAQIIADELYSPVTIVIDAGFSALACTNTQAVLGSAGSNDGLLIAGVIYPNALYDALTGSDSDGLGGNSEIISEFNANLGNSGCLENSLGWYYGFDTPPVITSADPEYVPRSDPGYVGVPKQYISSFFTVLLHEMTHGLGFASLVDISTGQKSGGLDDVFSNFLYSQADGALWNDLVADGTWTADQKRANSITSVTGLLWDGANVKTAAAALSGGATLTAGFHDADSSGTFSSGDRMQMYAPASLESGSSVSHFNTTASPNELMEPQYTDYLDSLGLALYVLKDIGWTVYPPSANNAPVLTNPGSRSMNTNDSLTIALAGYASDVDGDSLTFSAACSGLSCVVSGTSLNLSTDSSFSGGSVTLTVTDTASSSASQSFTVNLGNSYSLEVTHNGSPLTSGTLIGLLDYSFSLGNDHGQYSVSAYLNSQDVSELISVAGSVYSLNMPSSGTFAGPYDVVIYDGDAGITTHLELIRPPRISLNHSALLSGESHYQLDIEGAAPATDFDLSSSDSSVSFEDELGNPLSFSTASSNAASFHRASAWLVVSSNVQSSTTLTASASAYEDVSINDVPVYPAINYSLHLQNNQGDPLPGSLILNDSNLLTDLGIGLDADTSSGDLSLNLPAGTTVTGTASATNYTDTDFTLDGSNVDVTITLAENAVPVTISGTISGNGGLDFEQEAPQVSIKLSNNQTLSLTINVDSATQASFSKQLDLNSQSPSLLTISHSQSATATLGLGNVSTDKHFTVNMVKVSSSTSVTVVTSTNIGTKKGGAVLSYLLLCALPLMWRRRKNQQY